MIVLALIGNALATKRCASAPDTFCVTGTSSGNGTTTFTLHCKGEWCGIGLGTQMAGSFIYTGFKNEDEYVVYSYIGRGRVLPSVAPNQVAKIVPLEVPAPSWAKTAFSFTVPHKTSGNGDLTTQSSFIWATGNGVTNPGSTSASFRVHTDKGVFSDVDFATPSKSSGYKAFLAPLVPLVLALLF